MGQRHQVYMAMPVCYLCKGSGKRDDQYVKGECNGCRATGYPRGQRVVGLHHQWLYGHTAIEQLRRMLTFLRRAKESGATDVGGGIYDPTDILASVYSCSPEDGYFHPVCRFKAGEDDELTDPRLGDNNDGITIIDARDYKSGVVRYCFMSLDQGAGAAEVELPAFSPVSARAYVESYYPPGTARARKSARAIAETLDGIAALEVAVLTWSEVLEIFPALHGALADK